MTSPRLVITNTNLLDIHTLEFNAGQTIVTEQGRITWIGDEGSFEQEQDDQIIAGDNQFTIPGLFDMHVHLTYEQADLQNRTKFLSRRKEEYADFLAVKHAQSYLTQGVTTVRGCGGRNSLASLRQVIEEGKMVGPRLRLALKTLTQPGDQEYFGTQAMIENRRSNEVISGTDGVIHAVRTSKANGADHIKTTTTGGVTHGKKSMVNQVLWTEEELSAMVDEAERIGLYVAAHCHATPGIEAAIRAGVRTLEHATIMTDDTIDMILDRPETYVTPTLSAGTFIHHMSKSFKQELPEEMISKWEEVSAKMIQSHQLAYQKGVQLTVGTDAPVAGEHAHTIKEMELMVKHVEMPPLEVIRAGTLVSARAMKMGSELGSIEKDKIADMVLLAEDPTDDISILADPLNLAAVIKEGKIMAEKGRLVQ